jgi:hypothetical protein
MCQGCVRDVSAMCVPSETLASVHQGPLIQIAPEASYSSPGRPQSVQGTFREHSGNIQGTLRECT